MFKEIRKEIGNACLQVREPVAIDDRGFLLLAERDLELVAAAGGRPTGGGGGDVHQQR